ncbi:MAG: transposase family protein, partial [Catalinimonas sp.]
MQTNSGIRYSWKHRCPEQKATVMSDLEHAMIWFISPLHESSVHDKTMFERDFRSDRSKLAGRKFFADLGYQGIKKFCPEGRFVLPFKKPKEAELTQDQKRYNRLVSSLRIRVEHAIRGLKRYGMLSERNRTKDL